MDGFSVQYEKSAWDTLYQSSEKIYGAPRIKEIGPSPNVSLGRTSEWKVKGGYLIFMKMYGPDFYGREIKRPFTIIFDQKAE